jgi:diguanylate cyclase (GGDEF)-like protein/PAS domain S-box-containing protein
MLLRVERLDTFGAAERLARMIEPGSLLEATPECLVVAAGDGAIVYANARTEALTGFTRYELVGKPVQLLIASDLLGRPAGTRLESLCRTAEGGELPVEIQVGTVTEPEPLLVVTLRDIRDRIAAREARFEAEAKYRSLVEHIPAVVYLDPVDEDSLSMYVSPQVRDLIGIAPEEWVSDYYAWRNHVHPDDIDRAFAEYQQAYRDHVPLNHEYRMVHEDGTVKWVLEQAFPIDDEEGRPWLIQGVIFDITERKEAEEQIAFLAYHDKLTGLPNRHLFEEMLDNAIARARRAGRGVGVLYLDLDNFKQVNDSLGHHAGDLLLAQLGDRLRLCTRDTDLVARQGGDEFLVLLSDLDLGDVVPGGPDPAVEIACSVAARVRGALDEPFDLAGTSVQTTGSIGLSLFPRDAMDAETLLRNADQAMYRAKRGGVQGHVSFAAP